MCELFGLMVVVNVLASCVQPQGFVSELAALRSFRNVLLLSCKLHYNDFQPCARVAMVVIIISL